MIMIDLSFEYGGEGLICKVSISTLKSVCERDEWIENEFEIVYLKLEHFIFILKQL